MGKGFAVSEARSKRHAEAERLLAEAAQKVFEAQLCLGGGVDPAGWAACGRLDRTIMATRQGLQGIAFARIR